MSTESTPTTATQSAVEKAKKLRKAPADKKTAKAKSAKAKTSTRSASSDIPWARVQKAWEDGKTTSEITEHFSWTRKGDYPHSYTLGILGRLRKGVQIGESKFKIKPRNKHAA